MGTPLQNIFIFLRDITSEESFPSIFHTFTEIRTQADAWQDALKTLVRQRATQ